MITIHGAWQIHAYKNRLAKKQDVINQINITYQMFGELWIYMRLNHRAVIHVSEVCN